MRIFIINELYSEDATRKVNAFLQTLKPEQFVDIKYKTGNAGSSCYNCVMVIYRDI